MNNHPSTEIKISHETLRRLKTIAEPLTDTFDSVISRLIDYYEKTHDSFENEDDSGVFKTQDGTKIPFGEIYGSYKPRGASEAHTIKGAVTEKGIKVDGKIFNDPSSAVKYAKKNLGVGDSAASTNGWKFWYIKEPGSNREKSLSEIRKQQKYGNLTLKDLGL